MKNTRKYMPKLALVFMIFGLMAMMLCGCGSDAPETTIPPTTEATEPTTVPPTTVPPTTVPPTTVPQVMTSTEIAAYAKARTVTIHVDLGSNGSGEGSGFFISDDGIIVTCYHVIDGARGLSVEIQNGGTYKVDRILEIDPLHDIAVMKINLDNTPYFELGYAADGEDVRAVGSSLGTLQGTISQGGVSSVCTTIGVINCVQTDAAISNGNSGGPLINMYGEVIGINAYSYTRGQNLNLAIDVEYLRNMAMDRDWVINDYMEWYDIHTNRSYRIYSYTDGKLHPSLVSTYGEITGAKCMFSAWDWDFEDYVEGYDKNQSIFIYEYSSAQLDEYYDYLKSIGFVYDEDNSDYSQGVFYYYDTFNDYTATIVVPSNDEFVAIEIVHARQ